MAAEAKCSSVLWAVMLNARRARAKWTQNFSDKGMAVLCQANQSTIKHLRDEEWDGHDTHR